MIPHDTSVEAAAVQLGLWRQFGPAKRLRLANESSLACRALMLAGARARNDDEPARLWLGFDVPPGARMEDSDLDQLSITARIGELFDRLGVAYVLGGSLASSSHGEPRATRDSDLLAQLALKHVPQLVQAVEGEFYCSQAAMEEAVRRRGSFNFIHLASSFKVDVFVSHNRPFDRERLRRKNRLELDSGSLFISTPEDTLLAKLEWYRDGGEASEQQWRDILGIMAVQGDRLDLAYLNRWADELELMTLWQRAQESSGLS